MRRATLLLISMVVLAVGGCATDEPEVAEVPTGEKPAPGKKGPASSGPELKLNPDFKGN